MSSTSDAWFPKRFRTNVRTVPWAHLPPFLLHPCSRRSRLHPKAVRLRRAAGARAGAAATCGGAAAEAGAACAATATFGLYRSATGRSASKTRSQTAH
eukprot:5500330-Pleurochrysis_carterae.AAC.3